jgi:cytochrome c oxidase subunit II
MHVPSGAVPPRGAGRPGVRGTAVLAALAVAGCDGAPTYLRTSGYIGDREATLGWVLLGIASAVVVVIAVLVPAAIYRRRPGGSELQREEGGLSWIYIGGIAVPGLILIGVTVYSLGVLGAVATPPSRPAITVQVIGHTWWWEVHYPGQAPGDLVTVANEIHIPVGQPVRLELSTADVIHSFWFPQLAGKTDLIPGQRNVAWIEASTAGTYWGHCAEYCGQQHTNMMMSVVADPPAQFARWLEDQRRPAAEPTAAATDSGRAVFTRSACAVCHTIRGTGAGGALGPDLTHVGSRRTIAAGTLPNNVGNLAGWIGNPQALKPGVIMPAVPLRPEELHAVVSYLHSLQ